MKTDTKQNLVSITAKVTIRNNNEAMFSTGELKTKLAETKLPITVSIQNDLECFVSLTWLGITKAALKKALFEILENNCNVFDTSITITIED